jgi:uncharacterized membrane protein
MCAAAGILAAAGPAWAAGDEGPGLAGRLWRFTGVFHPLVVHFPVALLTLAAIVELMRLKYKEISPQITLICLLIASGGAVMAVIVGFARATVYDDTELLSLHQWSGIVLAVLTAAGPPVDCRSETDHADAVNPSGCARSGDAGGQPAVYRRTAAAGRFSHASMAHL